MTISRPHPEAADRALVAAEPPLVEQLRPLIDLVETGGSYLRSLAFGDVKITIGTGFDTG